MTEPSESLKSYQLNPFAFPSETDTRFLLLIMIIGGSIFSVMGIFVRFWSTSTWVFILGGLGAILIVFYWAWRWAQGYANNKIKREHWEPFPPENSDPLKHASLQQMSDYIQQIISTIPELNSISPDFVWDEESVTSHLPTGMAFGFRKKQYICLREGLHPAFIQLPNSDTFNVVLLHELGHIGNRDVSKTIFSIVLGKCFFLIMIPLLILLNLTTFFNLFEKMPQFSTSETWDAIILIFGINVKLMLIFLLIDITRSSILRVREYYADARARVWLGKTKPFLQVFATRNTEQQSAYSKNSRKWKVIVFRLQNIRAKIAPMHPKTSTRIQISTKTRELFRPSYGIDFLSGFLVGLSLNGNAYFISLLFEGGGILDFLNQQIQNSQGAAIIIGTMVFLFLEFIIWIGIILVVIVFGIAPIVSTTGLEIQKSAFADHFRGDELPLLPVSKLMGLALVAGLGIVFGGWVAPVPHFLSLQGQGLLFTPLYVIGWAGILLIWMLPLRWLAGRLYSRHTGESRPAKKQKTLVLLSAFALTPMLIAMSLLQVFSGVLITFPGDFSDSVQDWVGVVALFFHWAIWVIGWLILVTLGWLKQPHCPSCKIIVSDQANGLLNINCVECHNPIASWARLSSPLKLPSRPSLLKTPFSSTPPPL